MSNSEQQKMNDTHEKVKKKRKKAHRFSSEETYELIRIKTIENIENEIKERLFSKLKIWGLIFTVAIGVAGFLGFTNFWNTISRTIDDSVNSEVEKRIGPRILKLENRIDDSWESSILAKSTNQRLIETSENVETQILKSNQSIKQTTNLNETVKDSLTRLQNQIKTQDVELSRLKAQMVNLFESFKTESFIIENNKKTRILAVNEKVTLVIIRLESIPIEGSVKLQWHLYSQPPNSYFLNKNIVYFNWGDPIDNLSKHQAHVSYAADPTDNNVLGDLREVNGEIFAGEELLFGVKQKE